MKFEVIAAESNVEIGGVAEKNHIKIAAANDNAKAQTVRITIQVGCGPGANDLLNSNSDPITCRCDAQNKEDMELLDSTIATRAWTTSFYGIDLAASQSFHIELTSFPCETFPGVAKIVVKNETLVEDAWRTEGEVELTQDKKFNRPEKPTLHFFRMSPEYILHAGLKEVTASLLATGFQSAFLFRNNELVQSWRNLPGEPKDIHGEFTDQPSITSVYRLHLEEPLQPEHNTRPLPGLDEVRTVQIISPGWNRLTLPQGSPVRLFVANDLKSGRGDKLYGIFLRSWCDQDQNEVSSEAGLYSSNAGLDAWHPESGSVPQHMRTSPGVVYRNKLWLIGGSTVDSRKKPREVWHYGKDAKTNTLKWTQTELEYPPHGAGRYGHCCVVYGGEIWVLGGFDDKARNDAWRLKWTGKDAADNDKFAWASATPESMPWKSRCMHTAVAGYFMMSDGSLAERLWVYGGTTEIGARNRFRDLWYLHGGTWNEKKYGNATAIVPDPGEPVGAALVAYPDGDAKAGGKRLILLGSFREMSAPDQLGNRIGSSILEWHEGKGIWETSPVIGGWEQFKGETFSMHAVAFNRFLYTYSLNPKLVNPDRQSLRTFKLNINITS